MRLLFKKQKWITRQDLKNNPNTIYVFGDNLVGKGFGGQAKEMRGEPNALGIPTKRTPEHNKEALFTDIDLECEEVKTKIDNAFIKLHLHLKNGGNVIYPEDGIGTGLANLKINAPKILAYINSCVEWLEKKYG
jgi:hypothetical protein